MSTSGRVAVLAVLAAAAVSCSAPTAPSVPVQAAPTTEAAAAVPIRLATHCGIRDADFEGRHWVAITPAPEPEPVPGPSGSTRYDGYTTGTMTLLSPGLARFAADTATGPVQVDFRPAPAPPGLCD